MKNQKQNKRNSKTKSTQFKIDTQKEQIKRSTKKTTKLAQPPWK